MMTVTNTRPRRPRRLPIDPVIVFTVTAVDNIDFDNKEIIDSTKIRRVYSDIYKEIEVIDLLRDRDDVVKCQAIEVSVFDYLLIIDNVPHKILHCLTSLCLPRQCVAFPW